MASIRWWSILCVLALSGCFVSQDVLLLDAGKAVTPVPAGHYLRAGDKHAIVLTARADGWYTMTDADGDHDLLVTPLGAPGQEIHAAAFANTGCAAKPDTCLWTYAVLWMNGTQLKTVEPRCDDDGDAVARFIDHRSGDGNYYCYFTSVGALQRALLKIYKRKKINMSDTYTRQ